MMKSNVIIIGSFFLLSCSLPKITDEDIFGMWIANDSAVFEFKDDSTFVYQNVSAIKMFYSSSEYANQNFSGSGTWELEQQQRKCIVRLSFDKSPHFHLSGGYSCYFDISGSNWLGNKPPWHLFTWIGDPDNNERYSFFKKEHHR